MKKSTLNKLHRDLVARIDLTANPDDPRSGVLLTNGAWLVHVPDSLWPTDRARFTGVDLDKQGNIDPDRDTPDLDSICPVPLLSEVPPEAYQPLESSRIASKPIAGLRTASAAAWAGFSSPLLALANSSYAGPSPG